MKTTFLFALLFFLSFYAKGQEHMNERVWKKEVSRVIDTRAGGKYYSSIYKVIVAAIKSGKAGIYDPVENSFTAKMPQREAIEIVEPSPDTMELTDPIDGHSVIKIQARRIDIDSVYRYRIWEEWTFNPTTGKITIQIKYIAPMMDIIGDDGVFRGRSLLFWISFKDLSEAMKQHDGKKPLSAFYNSLWQSYFEPSDTRINAHRSSWRDDATGIIDFGETKDTATHFLRDENIDTSLCQLIVNEVNNDKIIAWSADEGTFSKQLTKADVYRITTPAVDTQTLVDPIDGFELIKITPKNYARWVYQYYIMQHWSFDPTYGRTEVEIAGIAPAMGNSYDKNYRRNITVLFWVHYKEIQPLINRIDQYHPTSTFAMHIWNSFFLSDTKPMLVK